MKLFNRQPQQPFSSFSEVEKPQPIPKNRKTALPDNSPVADLSGWQQGGWLKQEREPLQEAINQVYDKIKK